MTRMARADRPPDASPPRRAFLAALLLSLAGLSVALVLVRLHGQAHAGIASFCAISDTMNCDKVATSPYSVVLGLPVAAWGALAYGLGLVLSGWGLLSRRLHPTWPAGLLFLLGVGAVAASVALALVSELLIGAWCIMCITSWATSLGLLVAGWLACQPAGVAVTVGADLTALAGRPRLTSAAVVIGVALVAALLAGFPRYWEHSRAALARKPTPSGGVTPVLDVPLRDPAEGAVLFSDYECPFCAIAHAELKTVLAERPDIRVVKRHFPLDQACNPVVKRPLHLDACRWARAAICADEQGRFELMDDALYANQNAKKPVEALAARLGLDPERFRACLAAPATEQRLQADIAAGVAANVKATPTYVVGGGEYAGRLPVELFRKLGAPPPPAASPAAPPAPSPAAVR
jgi:protein-disulfide isomerase